ncbi:MAG: hypothetical protein K5651_01865 [Bacteroidales bacterium]|nr:hypothetical protein [Bacteroidales bacterium]
MHNVSYYANGRLWNDAECNQDLFIVPVEQDACTITGWVARDSEEYGNLCLFPQKPKRGAYAWSVCRWNYLKLPDTTFPSLRWEDEPIEVAVTIKRKEESKWN